MSEVERDAAGYTPGQIKALKIAIAVMTFAIVAGLAVMAVTIAYRASNYKRDAAAPDLRTVYPVIGAVAEGQLPKGGHVVAVSAWGDRLVLVVEDQSGTSLLVLDPKTAKLEPLARLRQTP